MIRAAVAAAVMGATAGAVLYVALGVVLRHADSARVTL